VTRGGHGQVIRAAGGVLWRPSAGGVEVALVHRPKYDDWSLPKGKLASDEHPLAGACREVLEETGITPVAGMRLVVQHYATPDGPKAVEYWAMRGRHAAFTPTSEVDRLAWLPLMEARQRLSYRRDADALDALGALESGAVAVNSPPVLLVRHAQAADPAGWEGDDSQRPLDVEGCRQAEALRRVLPAFGPSRLLSAGCVRCVDTLVPLAADLGMSVEIEPLLGEVEYATHPRGARGLIRELAEDTGGAVVCSQGAVVSHLLAALADEDGLAVLGEFWPKRCGSAWALSFSGGRLAAADYYPAFTSPRA